MLGPEASYPHRVQVPQYPVLGQSHIKNPLQKSRVLIIINAASGTVGALRINKAVELCPKRGRFLQCIAIWHMPEPESSSYIRTFGPMYVLYIPLATMTIKLCRFSISHPIKQLEVTHQKKGCFGTARYLVQKYLDPLGSSSQPRGQAYSVSVYRLLGSETELQKLEAWLRYPKLRWAGVDIDRNI